MNVGVGHFVTGDDHADLRAAERPLLRLRNRAADVEHVSVQLGGRVDPVVNLFDRHHEHMAGRNRID